VNWKGTDHNLTITISGLYSARLLIVGLQKPSDIYLVQTVSYGGRTLCYLFEDQWHKPFGTESDRLLNV